MKIMLVNPSQENVYGKKLAPPYPPLGLLYIGTVLKNEKHNTLLLDIDTENIDDEKFKEIFKDFNPDAVGLTSVTPTVNNAFKWAKLAKGIKEVPVIFGGIHATIAPEEIIKEGFVDIVVVGEGEETARELFNELSKSAPDLTGIKGIYFKDGDKIVANERRPLIADLDSLPFPDRRLLKNPIAFMPPDAEVLPVATIMTSRGCPGDCTFCCTKHIFSKRLRIRSVKNIINEIKSLMNNNGIKEIHIADDTFTAVKRRVFEFCDEIKKQDIKIHLQFMNGLRADFVDREVLTALKGIGIKTVGYGVESGSEKILKNIKKNIPLATTRNAYRISKELGFETWAFLIFGLPGETEETIKETIKFTKEIDPDFAKFLILKPYPGSEVYTELKQNDLIRSYDYDNYGVYTRPVHALPGLDPEKMISWQKRAFREFYLRPAKILSHLKRIRSWQQLRLIINGVMFTLYCMFRDDKK